MGQKCNAIKNIHAAKKNTEDLLIVSRLV